MLSDIRLRKANALMLQWHSEKLGIRFEAFRLWALATLKQRIPFDGAIWADVGMNGKTNLHINGAYLYQIDKAAMTNFESVRSVDFSARRGAGSSTAVCQKDEEWQSSAYAAMRQHARDHDLANSVSARSLDLHAPVQQFILLSRKSPDDRFGDEEVQEFELLAPHLMQAYAACRRAYLETPGLEERGSATYGVTLIDREGMVHEHQDRFESIMRREWSDWPGVRLPPGLLEITSRRAGTPWRFLGNQVTAEFLPVDDLYLVTIRPRHVADVLTNREAEIAQRYAGGANFREIAESLGLAPPTVRTHLRNVFSKLHIRNKAQLASSLR